MLASQEKAQSSSTPKNNTPNPNMSLRRRFNLLEHAQSLSTLRTVSLPMSSTIGTKPERNSHHRERSQDELSHSTLAGGSESHSSSSTSEDHAGQDQNEDHRHKHKPVVNHGEGDDDSGSDDSDGEEEEKPIHIVEIHKTPKASIHSRTPSHSSPRKVTIKVPTSPRVSPSSPPKSTVYARQSRSHADTSQGSRQYQRQQRPLSPTSTTSRAWYQFDLAVVAALVSPIGNWLTGGDHVKNIVLVALLIFYLHQIIEIPWALYQNARPKRHPPHFEEPRDLSPDDQRASQLALSELHKLEIFYLFLTMLSPFFGALLLQYATTAVLGPDSISWFSIGLFVLATGMRPWSHLVNRLSSRTSALHDVIHYPPSPVEVSQRKFEREREELLSKLNEVMSKMGALEKSQKIMRAKVGNELDDMFDRFEDGLDAISKALTRQTKRLDIYEERINHTDEQVAQVKGIIREQEEQLKTHQEEGQNKNTGIATLLSAAAHVFNSTPTASSAPTAPTSRRAPPPAPIETREPSIKDIVLDQMLPSWLYTASASPRHREMYRQAHEKYLAAQAEKQEHFPYYKHQLGHHRRASAPVPRSAPADMLVGTASGSGAGAVDQGQGKEDSHRRSNVPGPRSTAGSDGVPDNRVQSEQGVAAATAAAAPGGTTHAGTEGLAALQKVSQEGRETLGRGTPPVKGRDYAYEPVHGDREGSLTATAVGDKKSKTAGTLSSTGGFAGLRRRAVEGKLKMKFLDQLKRFDDDDDDAHALSETEIDPAEEEGEGEDGDVDNAVAAAAVTGPNLSIANGWTGGGVISKTVWLIAKLIRVTSGLVSELVFGLAYVATLPIRVVLRMVLSKAYSG